MKKKSFFNGNQDFNFVIDEGRHDKSLFLRWLSGCLWWREGREAVMFISSLSQEQLHRQSPLSVLSTHGVKPHGGLDLAQPATTMGRIHQIFSPAVIWDLWVFILAFKWGAMKSEAMANISYATVCSEYNNRMQTISWGASRDWGRWLCLSTLLCWDATCTAGRAKFTKIY